MQSRFKKKLAILFLVLISLNLIGCWDLWEIEDRGLVLGLGIEEIPIEEMTNFAGVEGQLLKDASNRAVRDIFQFAIPAGLSGEKSGGGPTYYNLNTTAPLSALELRGLAATKSSRKGYLDHLQVIILGEKIAKKGIYPALERVMRDPDVRKQVPILVTEGDVEEVLNISSKQEAMPALYLAALMQNRDWAHRMPPEMPLGTIFRRIREEAVYVIPRVTPGKNDSKLAGGGIFYGDRLVGWLGEEETIAFRWLTNQVQVAPITTAVNMKNGVKLVDGYLAERSKTIIRPEIVDGKLKIVVKIITAGSLLERQLQDNLWEEQVLAEIEEELAKALAGDLELLINKAQEELRLDIFGFGKHIERRYPKVWREIKKDWHKEYFPGILTEVNVHLTITRTGLLR